MHNNAARSSAYARLNRGRLFPACVIYPQTLRISDPKSGGKDKLPHEAGATRMRAKHSSIHRTRLVRLHA